MLPEIEITEMYKEAKDQLSKMTYSDIDYWDGYVQALSDVLELEENKDAKK